MQHVLNKNEIVYGIRKLNVGERLSLITDIWDEIKDARELETVSESDKKLLLNRLSNYRENPDSASYWDDLRQEIYDKYS